MELLIENSQKRTREMFLGNYGNQLNDDIASQRLKLTSKIFDEYEQVKILPAKLLDQTAGNKPGQTPSAAPTSDAADPSNTSQLIDNLPISKKEDIRNPATMALVKSNAAEGGNQALILRNQHYTPKPKWHPPWKIMRVISGHMGWVRAVAVDPSNEWFCTGAADKTIKIWDMATGTLKLSLTGHIGTIRGLVVSDRHPYIFSCGDDNMVKCWDLEVNKVTRHYHGHLSGVYSIALHPTLDIIATAGRDAVVRIWDIRSMQEVFTLSGHTNTISTVCAQGSEPQIVTASMDSTVRLWDLAAAKTRTVLTNHKKSVRALVLHPNEYTFASGSPDNIKQWKFPDGDFLQNLSGHRAIVNSLSANQDNVLFSGADNGSVRFWDWKSGYCFQEIETVIQPGSLDSEAGIFASTFDRSGSRLITVEADKTIKMWKEDDNATEETHPIQWKAALKKTKF